MAVPRFVTMWLTHILNKKLMKVIRKTSRTIITLCTSLKTNKYGILTLAIDHVTIMMVRQIDLKLIFSFRKSVF